MTQDTIIRQIVLKRELDANKLSPREKDVEEMKTATAGLTNDSLLTYGINKEHYMAMAEAVFTYERGLFYGLFDKGGPQAMSEEDIIKYFNDYYLSYKIIEVSLTEDGKDMDDDAKKKELEKLQDYLDMYETEKDFDKVIAKYKEDTTPTSSGTGSGTGSTAGTTQTTTTTTAAVTDPTGTGATSRDDRNRHLHQRERAPPAMMTRTRKKIRIPIVTISTQTCTGTKISPMP